MKCTGKDNGCTCHRHVKCEEGCTCYKHRNASKKCDPDCACGRHGPYRGDHRAAWYARKYGITIERYHEMLAGQSGGCAICGTRTPGRNWLFFAVDHDHITGKVRGLLCCNCNRALGWFGDDLDRVKTAVKYLEAQAP